MLGMGPEHALGPQNFAQTRGPKKVMYYSDCMNSKGACQLSGIISTFVNKNTRIVILSDCYLLNVMIRIILNFMLLNVIVLLFEFASLFF